MKLFLEIPLQLHVFSLNWRTHPCFFLVPMLACLLAVKRSFRLVKRIFSLFPVCHLLCTGKGSQTHGY